MLFLIDAFMRTFTIVGIAWMSGYVLFPTSTWLGIAYNICFLGTAFGAMLSVYLRQKSGIYIYLLYVLQYFIATYAKVNAEKERQEEQRNLVANSLKSFKA